MSKKKPPSGIFSTIKRPPKQLEFNSGELKIETAGYIPAKIRIKNLKDAGIRLMEARKEMYDFPQGVNINDNYHDPTRDPNFDMADASRIQQATENRLKTQESEDKARKTAESNAQESKARADANELKQFRLERQSKVESEAD